ncbi:sensor histidine kinase [Amycolatopsis keratiniphila]|uniref:histidine kinase n=1 Tax=Amycolatopsis keratiniphila subsp. keratiniphila TaxID=227715 RepID=A0A1W2LHZ4_9PSEU|nr:histidine kinase [Amycolatopsis keratiniphila]OLZ54174.1 two-component sensor histidine kinase [Amycolatopsis keratiniphila subsp. nogabecina]ONF62350.1 two-component sensor histidine kinase [Amycolatopsis keratiniphila subsp. keratiniphila]SDU63737.1 Signal transduction histidine kinase [Amycolatopsis keratiniphila]
MQRLLDRLRAHPWVTDLPLYAWFVFLAPTGSSSVPKAVLLVPYLFLLPLLWRRRHPEIVAVLILAGVTAQYTTELWAYDRGRGELAMAVALYTLVRAGNRRFATLIAAWIVALDVTWGLVWGITTEQGGWLTIVVTLPLHVAAWALGEFFRARQRLSAEEATKAKLAASEQEARARAAVAEERTRIARELHDVLAHSVSVIVINAEGAKLMRDKDPEVVDRTLDTIGKAGRDALAELRRLLEVLHAGEAARSPQPTVAELRDLVAQVSASGRDVDLQVTGDAEGLPPSAALQAYRIVQESLTNMIKHAPGDASGQVEIDFGHGGHRRNVRIEVTNTGGSEPVAPRLPSSGRGIAGMTQRVEMFHGTLDTGPTRDGGYRVAANLVVEAG